MAIHLPKNTPAGFIIAIFSATCGFAVIWHMWLPAAAAFAAMLLAIIVHTFNYDRDTEVSADEVRTIERSRTALLAGHV